MIRQLLKHLLPHLLWRLPDLLRRFWPSPPQRPGLAHIYTDRRGRRHYRYEDLLQMPMKRLIALEAAGRFVELNLTRERLLGLLAAFEERAAAQDWPAAFRIAAELRLRAEGVVEEENLLAAAAVYFVREDEDPTDYDAAFARAKAAEWREDPQAAAFFLSAWLRWAASWSEASAAEWLDTLERLRPLSQALNRASWPTKSEP